MLPTHSILLSRIHPPILMLKNSWNRKMEIMHKKISGPEIMMAEMWHNDVAHHLDRLFSGHFQTLKFTSRQYLPINSYQLTQFFVCLLILKFLWACDNDSNFISLCVDFQRHLASRYTCWVESSRKKLLCLRSKIIRNECQHRENGKPFAKTSLSLSNV